MKIHLPDRRLPSALVVLIIAIACGAGLSACSSTKGSKVENHPPFVRLTGGPVARAPGQNGIPLTDSVSYTTEFLWTGWDDDGIIDHYQYAIDIPDDLMGKLNDSNPNSGIAWRDTTAFRARFRFTATTQDSVLQGDGTWYLPELFRSDHTFYVRAVDNDGGVSQAAHVTFTARTVTPQTKFTVPASLPTSTYLSVGRVLNVAWEGVDPDNPDPRKKPAGYEWKLIDLYTVVPGDPRYAANAGDVQWWLGKNDPPSPGESVPWTRIGADTTKLTLYLDVGGAGQPAHDYVLGIRAFDEAGGVESRFIRGQNAAVLNVSSNFSGTPKVVVKEKMAGSFTFPDDGEIWQTETPVNRCLRFDFVADAKDYGGQIEAYNYGVDVVDADADGPNSGFVGWSGYPYTYTPICFRSAGIHAVTIKVRDTGGGITICTVILKVVDFPMDRSVLYIDDVLDRSGTAMPDAKTDSRIIDMLTSIGFTTNDKDPLKNIFQMDPFGPGDVQFTPDLIKLSDLARYRYVIWAVNGVAYNSNPALVSANACESGRVLQAYVGAGGGVWIFGQRVYACFKKDSRYSECKSFLGYNEGVQEGLMFTAPALGALPTFVYDFLGVTDGGNFHTEENSRTNGIIRVAPGPDAAGRAVPFPPVEIDSTVTKASLGGIPFCDVMYQRSEDKTGGLDTVYTVQTAATARSAFVGKAIGLSYADPNPVPSQGPVIVFGMPPWLMKPGEVHLAEDGENYTGTGVKGMAGAVFAWFRQNAPAARAALQP